MFRYLAERTVYEVDIKQDKYENGRVALLLVGGDGSNIACATVNIPEEPLNEGEVLIKTWSENANMLPFLIKNKIVEDTGRDVPVGYVKARVCRLLIQSLG